MASVAAVVINLRKKLECGRVTVMEVSCQTGVRYLPHRVHQLLSHVETPPPSPPPSTFPRAEAPPTSPSACCCLPGESGWCGVGVTETSGCQEGRKRSTTQHMTDDKMSCHRVVFGFWLCLAEMAVKSLQKYLRIYVHVLLSKIHTPKNDLIFFISFY